MSDEMYNDNTLDFGEKHFGEGEEVRKAESDRETNKRAKEMPIDRLSELPDCLLIHILSFLGVQKAGITSVLSKRWKCLWAELPRLEFPDNVGLLELLPWVNRTLDVREGSYLEKFQVTYAYRGDYYGTDVDNWVEFSVKSKVKELDLTMIGDTNYTLPQILYSCSSLTDLHLYGCTISPESKIEWQSLTRLSLESVDLDRGVIDEILSSCSVLKSLDLESCWGFTRLDVNSRYLDYLRLRKLALGSYLEISAPYVPILNIEVNIKERNWQLKNISSVLDASIDIFNFWGECSEEMMSNAKEFLEKFKHVEKLYIEIRCFEVLSIMAIKGWQLPQFSLLRSLTLVSFSNYEHNISGVIVMLESSPNLETLLLEGWKTSGSTFDLDPTTKGDLDGDLLHLKTIRVNNFADSNGEPLLTLASILLKRAPVLEEMMIAIDVKDTSDYVNIAEKLLTYPRSSTKAEIRLISRK